MQRAFHSITSHSITVLYSQATYTKLMEKNSLIKLFKETQEKIMDMQVVSLTSDDQISLAN